MFKVQFVVYLTKERLKFHNIAKLYFPGFCAKMEMAGYQWH